MVMAAWGDLFNEAIEASPCLVPIHCFGVDLPFVCSSNLFPSMDFHPWISIHFHRRPFPDALVLGVPGVPRTGYSLNPTCLSF